MALNSGYSGLLSNQGEKKYTLLFHNGSFKKKALKYGTPQPSIWGIVEGSWGGLGRLQGARPSALAGCFFSFFCGLGFRV